jgi:hypothetical protein
MATVIPLTMHQSNDEVIDLVITPVVPGDDLTLITALRLYIKPDVCTDDSDPSVTVLSSSDPAQITITAQSATEIDATAYVPAASLAEPYSLVWRIDAWSGTMVRTALYGPVAVIDL